MSDTTLPVDRGRTPLKDHHGVTIYVTAAGKFGAHLPLREGDRRWTERVNLKDLERMIEGRAAPVRAIVVSSRFLVPALREMAMVGVERDGRARGTDRRLYGDWPDYAYVYDDDAVAELSRIAAEYGALEARWKAALQRLERVDSRHFVAPKGDAP